MPKGFLVKRLEEMSVLEPVPYRPWCEGEQQDSPVDFSIKGRKKCTTSADSADIRSQLVVRTPDSGFSSPSESEFMRKHSLVVSPGSQFTSNNLYQKVPFQVEEQVAPLALIKKKKQSVKDIKSYSSSCEISSEKNSISFKDVTSPVQNDSSSFLSSQASAFQLFSSSLYWPHGSTPLNPSVPFTSLVSSAYDLSLAQKGLRDAKEIDEQSLLSPTFVHSTPIKSPPRSPGSSITSPIKRKTPSSSVTPEKKTKSLKKTKASRRLNFDEDKTSPVSGTIIRQLEEGEEPLVIRKGDIDPAYNVVEITDEAKAELSKIENKIGDYVCRLCKELYDDAFGLAQHRCSRIIHVEYRCPECDKVFNCPANLASHRRWHKPKGNVTHLSSSDCHKTSEETNENLVSKGNESICFPKLFNNNCISTNNNCITTNNNCNNEPPELLPLSDITTFPSDEMAEQYECQICYKKFKRQSYLRKHLMTHNQSDSESNEDLHCSSLTPLSSPHDHSQLFSPHSPQINTINSLLSPPFPDNVYRCRICSATFFTPAALQLHSSALHGTVEDHSPRLSSTLHMPLSQYSPKAGMLSPSSLYSSYPFLHQPSQISAPS